MNFEELKAALDLPTKEQQCDWHRHQNADGSLGGWQHRDTEIGQGVFLHEEAAVGKGVRIGDGAYVGIFTTIGNNAFIGPRSVIGNLSNVDPGARVGANVSVGSQSRILSTAVIEDGRNIPDQSVVDGELIRLRLENGGASPVILHSDRQQITEQYR
jgi:acetyltransferase-like isoleucine patch superfamily enzyme